MSSHSIFRITFTSWVLTTLLSCSGGGGDGSPGSGNKPKQPQSPEEALAQLSEGDRAQLEAWKKTLTKSCNASEAFGTSKESVDSIFGWGIDAAQFSEKNQGSSVIRHQNEVVFISDYETLSGTGESNYSMNINNNGSQYSVQASTKRSGSNCKLYVSDQLVYETLILSKFKVHGYLNPMTSVIAKSGLVETKQIQAPNAQGKAEAYSQGIAELIRGSFDPSQMMTSMLAEKFGITEVESKKAFVKDTSLQNAVMRLSADNNSLWTRFDGNPNLISSKTTLDQIFNSQQNVSFDFSIKNAVFNFSSPKIKIGEPGRFTFIVNLTTSPQSKGADGKPTEIIFSSAKILIGGAQAPSYELAKQCFLDRLTTYKLDTPTKGISPSYDFAINPCEYLTENLRKEMAPLNRVLVPMMFSHLKPVLPFQFNGWDSILRITVLEVLANNENLNQVLDPSKTNPFIQRINPIVEDMKMAPTLKPISAELKQSLENLAITWSLALKNVETLTVQKIVSATSNSYAAFPASTQSVIMQLGWEPDLQIAELDFAKNLTDAYITSAMRAQNLAAALNYSEFTSKVYNRILQDRPDMAKLQKWVNRLESVQNGLNAQGEKLSAVRGELTSATIGWLDSNLVKESDVSSIYTTLAKVGTVFPESLKSLINQLAQDYNTHKVALKYIDDISPEFISSAQQIKNLSAKLGMESKGLDFFKFILQKRPTLESVKQIEATWIAAQDFSNREMARVKDNHSSPWAIRNRNAYIERGVEEGWSATEFQGLETIAELAKFKPVCERYPDRSSLAECGRDGHFSKSTKKLFDPSFSNRYVDQAKTMIAFSEKLSAFEHQNLRRKLVDSFFGSFDVLWDKCTNDLFSSKRSTLTQQLGQFLKEKDQFKLWELERKIDDTLKNCN